MARTTIPTASIITPIGPYPSLPVAALAAHLTWQASDVANLNQFPLSSGKYVILMRNVHASSAFTWTLTSATDERRRTGDISTYSLAAGAQSAFLLDNYVGWLQSDGMMYLNGSDANIQFCILRLP